MIRSREPDNGAGFLFERAVTRTKTLSGRAVTLLSGRAVTLTCGVLNCAAFSPPSPKVLFGTANSRFRPL
jgi:hypothetical protein